jgi:hypothetical protein
MSVFSAKNAIRFSASRRIRRLASAELWAGTRLAVVVIWRLLSSNLTRLSLAKFPSEFYGLAAPAMALHSGRPAQILRHALLAAPALVIALAFPCSADDLVGQATVIDGDTVEIHDQRIRL